MKEKTVLLYLPTLCVQIVLFLPFNAYFWLLIQHSKIHLVIFPESEFNEFQPRLKSAKNRFQLSAAGLKFQVILHAKMAMPDLQRYLIMNFSTKVFCTFLVVYKAMEKLKEKKLFESEKRRFLPQLLFQPYRCKSGIAIFKILKLCAQNTFQLSLHPIHLNRPLCVNKTVHLQNTIFLNFVIFSPAWNEDDI